MKLLVSSDWHLDIPPRPVDRWDDLFLQTNRIYETIRKTGATHFFHLGDVTDPDSGARTIRALSHMSEFYKRLLGKHTCVQLAGNHDVIDDERFTHSLAPLEVWGLKVYAKPAEICPRQGIRFLFLPYLSGAHAPTFDNRGKQERMTAQGWLNSEVNEFLQNRLAIDEKCWVFCHLDIDGAVTGSEERMLRGGKLVLPPQLEDDSRVELIVGGHIHRAQRVREKIAIVGSIDRLDFGERDDRKGYITIEI